MCTSIKHRTYSKRSRSDHSAPHRHFADKHHYWLASSLHARSTITAWENCPGAPAVSIHAESLQRGKTWTRASSCIIEVLRISNARRHAVLKLYARFAVLLPQYTSDLTIRSAPTSLQSLTVDILCVTTSYGCIIPHRAMSCSIRRCATSSIPGIHHLDLHGLCCWLCCVLGLLVLKLVPVIRQYD